MAITNLVCCRMDKNDPYSTFFDLEASGIAHDLSHMSFINNACSLWRIRIRIDIPLNPYFMVLGLDYKFQSSYRNVLRIVSFFISLFARHFVASLTILPKFLNETTRNMLNLTL